MIVVDMLIWWYGVGWLERVLNLKDIVYGWANYFSFGTLLQTLFQPWKQIVTATSSDSSLDARKNAILDNLVSRFVGFTVRISVLFFGICVVMFMIVLHAAYIFVWPMIPVAPIIFIILGAV